MSVHVRAVQFLPWALGHLPVRVMTVSSSKLHCLMLVLQTFLFWSTRVLQKGSFLFWSTRVLQKGSFLFWSTRVLQKGSFLFWSTRVLQKGSFLFWSTRLLQKGSFLFWSTRVLLFRVACSQRSPNILVSILSLTLPWPQPPYGG